MQSFTLKLDTFLPRWTNVFFLDIRAVLVQKKMAINSDANTYTPTST